jgi:predicted Fe-Mo cluster-binding NifX family protein
MITITTTKENREEVAYNLNHIVKEGGEVIVKNNYGQNKFKKVKDKLIKVW